MLERLRFPGITGVELWDVVVDGTPLHEHPVHTQPTAIARAVLALSRGQAQRADGAALAAARFDEVVVAGGGRVDDVVTALASAGFPARTAADPVYAASAAGFHALRSRGVVDGIVIDLGQTSVKTAVDGGPRARLPRPTDALAFLAGACVHGRTVLALPCEIDDDGTLGACTYWPAGTHFDDAVLAGNDAELAAASVALARGHADRGMMLVLTVGFGVGAALVLGGVSL